MSSLFLFGGLMDLLNVDAKFSQAQHDRAPEVLRLYEEALGGVGKFVAIASAALYEADWRHVMDVAKHSRQKSKSKMRIH